MHGSLRLSGAPTINGRDMMETVDRQDLSQPESSKQLLARARDLIPYLQGKSDEINVARRVTDEVGQRLTDAGLWTIMRPKKYGGIEAPMDLMYRITQQLARGDASAGWVYVVLNTHDRFMGFFPPQVQEQYWTSARPKCASSYNPTGKATAAPGGYTLSGKWSFCSGIDFCDWVVPGGIVGMLPADRPVPDMRYFLVPTSAVKIIDDWHVMGLRGTGSKSIILDNVFVPDERVVSEAQIVTGTTPGAHVHDSPTYRAPGWAVFVFSLPAVAPATVRSAYEEFKADCRGRVSRREGPFEIRKPAVQMCLAEASVLLDNAELLYDRALGETFAELNRVGDVSPALRIRNRRDLNYSVLLSRRVSEMLMAMGGGRATQETGRIQRALRDLHAISVHPAMNWETPALSYGAAELGEKSNDPFA
jgi:alkylation response protein AidB-like acyl-CoA dehydrogenase